ncbi:MAG: cellulase family glycosylhydrolase, partial [Fibrobacterota bacterium]
YGKPEEWSGGTAEAREILNAYNLAVVNTIRSSGGNNAPRHIMIPTHAATSIAAAQDDLVIPNDDSRIIVSQHTYWPYNFTMNTGSGATDQWGSSRDKEACDQELDRIYEKFCAKGIPVVIGEWGSIDRSNTEARAVHAGYYAREVRKRGMLSVWWDNGWTGAEGFALLDRDAGTWCQPEIVDSLIQGAESGTTTKTQQIFHSKPCDIDLRIFSGSIGYVLPVASSVALTMFTMQGEKIFSHVSDVKSVGYHTFSLPVSKVSSGTYILKLKSQAHDFTRNISITK